MPVLFLIRCSILNSFIHTHTESFACICGTSSSSATLNMIPEKALWTASSQKCPGRSFAATESLLSQRWASQPLLFNGVLSLHGEYSLSPTAIRQSSTSWEKSFLLLLYGSLLFLLKMPVTRTSYHQGTPLTPNVRLEEAITVVTAHS